MARNCHLMIKLSRWLCKNHYSIVPVANNCCSICQGIQNFDTKMNWSYSAFVLVNLGTVTGCKCTITASGYEQKALVAQPAVTSPGTLARKLSRRARHHGAIFASHGERLNCLGCRNCPEPVLRNW
jgi:hypothetical protein